MNWKWMDELVIPLKKLWILKHTYVHTRTRTSGMCVCVIVETHTQIISQLRFPHLLKLTSMCRLLVHPGMRWETGSSWGPIPAWQLNRMSAARAPHSTGRQRGSTVALRIPLLQSFLRCHALMAHEVRARQDEESVALLVAGRTARWLVPALWAIFLLLLPLWVLSPCIQELPLLWRPVSRVKSPQTF